MTTAVIMQPRLSRREFNLFRSMILEHCGIRMADTKMLLLQNRIGKRLKALGHLSFREYYEYITTDQGRREELVHLWSAITTNETHFFREPRHFDVLRRKILPELLAHKPTGTISVWSAGCSTGQEVYTLAIVLREFCEGRPGWKFNVLGTDIDIGVLSVAEAGTYPTALRKEIPTRFLLRYFDVDTDALRVKPSVSQHVQFRHQNLRRLNGRSSRRYDLIFCRNVMMYLDRTFRQELTRFFHRSLLRGGYLFLGTSETLVGMPDRVFEPVKFDRTIVYRRRSHDNTTACNN